MTKGRRFPADVDEFFRRLEVRKIEPDLSEELSARLLRERRPVTRVGDPTTVLAFVRRVVPSGAVPPEALAAFLDEVFDQQKGRADEQVGLLPRARLTPAGFTALDAAAYDSYGRSFASLSAEHQDALIARAERSGVAGPDGFASGYWFKRVREILLLGYGSDPRGMVEMGFPGPTYETGHVWLDRREVRSRVERMPGYMRL